MAVADPQSASVVVRGLRELRFLRKLSCPLVNGWGYIMTAVSGKGIVFGVAAVLFGATILNCALAQTPTVLFAGSNHASTLDCAGGGAQIAGSNNKLILTGGCTMLSVLGSNNAVTVALAANARIQLVGSNDAVAWTSPDGKEPMVQYLGSDNTLTPAPQQPKTL
jgi:hypothetical protein